MNNIEQFIWSELNREIDSLRGRVDAVELKTQRAETAGGVRSYTYAERPLAATGGVSDNTEYTDFIYITDARKTGETAGNGTGCPAYYDASIDDYRRFSDDSIVAV